MSLSWCVFKPVSLSLSWCFTKMFRLYSAVLDLSTAVEASTAPQSSTDPQTRSERPKEDGTARQIMQLLQEIQNPQSRPAPFLGDNPCVPFFYRPDERDEVKILVVWKRPDRYRSSSAWQSGLLCVSKRHLMIRKLSGSVCKPVNP